MGEGQEPKPVASVRVWLQVLTVVLVAGAAFAGSGAVTCAYHALAPTRAQRPADTLVVRGTSAVVSAVRDLARLEGASYHMERVIDVRDRQAHLFGLFESEDTVLLVAAADVVAGVDLTTMRDGDIRFDPEHRWAQVTLPPPSVFSARLDNEHTYVHSRRTDRLALRAESLETRARQEAESALRDAAVEAGILERARGNCARTVKTLIESLGFARVEVVFRDRER